MAITVQAQGKIERTDK